MNYRKNYNAYKKTGIETATRGELVVMLYEGGIRFINEAIKYIGDYKTYDKANKNIQKTADIIGELRASLDRKAGGELADRLESIYEYILRQLNAANAEKSAEKLIEVRGYLEEILVSWKEAVHRGHGLDESGPGFSGGFSITG